MIHRWKALDLEITDGGYLFGLTFSRETTPSQTLNLKHVEITEFMINVYVIHHWKALDLEITDFEYHHDRIGWSEIIPSQTITIDETIQFIFIKLNFRSCVPPLM